MPQHSGGDMLEWVVVGLAVGSEGGWVGGRGSRVAAQRGGGGGPQQYKVSPVPRAMVIIIITLKTVHPVLTRPRGSTRV
ncbi:hypothetical protein Pcinc_018675 [Petrolisthes cinctipes]|uniref:Uncharacterized protein n=1 Tax=Petrolisthes cinctipes TaxID=88211 RepID=A0AAE1KMH2_PETCI|nr:hypothetical protein Pcinc_018675 [Petrolisthes cinctipes]